MLTKYFLVQVRLSQIIVIDAPANMYRLLQSGMGGRDW